MSPDKKRKIQKGFFNYLCGLRKVSRNEAQKRGFFVQAREFLNDVNATQEEVYLQLDVALQKGLGSSPKQLKPKPPIENHDFYYSRAWMTLRYRALSEYGAVCMCCNSEENIHVDHIKPRSRYPAFELDFNNVQVLCRTCNMGKSNWDRTDWRPEWAKEKYPMYGVRSRPEPTYASQIKARLKPKNISRPKRGILSRIYGYKTVH